MIDWSVTEIEPLLGTAGAYRALAEVWATLLDEQTYLCSERTMYRILAAAGQLRERGAQLTHPAYGRPELLAKAPNEVHSWDITKLKGPAKWTYYYLYVILDVFSRYAVGWTVQHREDSHVAKDLIAQVCDQQQIQSGQLTVHADRGSSMTSSRSRSCSPISASPRRTTGRTPRPITRTPRRSSRR